MDEYPVLPSTSATIAVEITPPKSNKANSGQASKNMEANNGQSSKVMEANNCQKSKTTKTNNDQISIEAEIGLFPRNTEANNG